MYTMYKNMYSSMYTKEVSRHDAIYFFLSLVVVGDFLDAKDIRHSSVHFFSFFSSNDAPCQWGCDEGV